MPRGKPFAKGNKAASVQKGTKKKKTIVKEKLQQITDIEELKEDVLREVVQLLSNGKVEIRLAIVKELLKYLFPQKKAEEEPAENEIKIDLNVISNRTPTKHNTGQDEI